MALSATAAVAFLAPAANASSSDHNRGQLRVCAFGLGSGDEVEVDIWGRGDWSGDLRGCAAFRAARGVYSIDIDVPDGYRLSSGDDDRTVRVHSGERTTVRFWLDETHGDDCDDEDCGDGSRFVRVDEDDHCPDGYEPSRVNDQICVRD